MPLDIARLAKRLIRRMALDDLGASLTVAAAGLRLLRLAARSPEERKLAASMVAVLDEARLAVRWLRSQPHSPLDVLEEP